MPFRNVATLLAEGVSVDRATGRLSAFNMMESVLAPSFPAILGKLVIVNLYEIDDGREPYWERVTILDDTGLELARLITELTGEAAAHRSMSMIQGLKLAKPGVYKVVVEGAKRADGQWRSVNVRHFRAELRPHPLSRVDEKDPASGKISGPAALTD